MTFTSMKQKLPWRKRFTSMEVKKTFVGVKLTCMKVKTTFVEVKGTPSKVNKKRQ